MTSQINETRSLAEIAFTSVSPPDSTFNVKLHNTGFLDVSFAGFAVKNADFGDVRLRINIDAVMITDILVSDLLELHKNQPRLLHKDVR